MTRGTRKRLLFINNRFPFPIEMGIDARVINLLAVFSQKIDLDFVCLADQENSFNYIPELKKYCRHLEAFLVPNRKSMLHRLLYKIMFVLSYLFRGTPSHLFYTSLSEIKKRILNLIRNNSYDIIFFEYWFWDKELIQACNGLKVIDTNDVQFIRESKIQERKAFPLLKPFIKFQMYRYKKKELERMKLFDLIIATREEDRETFHRFLGSQKKTIIFPTGVDTDYFSPRVLRSAEKTVTFYGAMSSNMNIDGALYLYRKIMPFIWEQQKDAKLMILGSNPPSEIRALASDPRVTVTGYVKDVRDYLAMGTVVTLPLRMEYGHRGRIFEVMSMAIPIVLTPQVVQGMEIRNGEGLLIEDSPQSFARAVLNLLDDQGYAVELGMKGRKAVIERFSVQATYDRMIDFLVEYIHTRN